MKKSIVAVAVGISLLGSALPAFAETTEVQGSMIGQLHRGAKGDSVKLLQALLAADSTIYPEGIVSGYYGALTAFAVQRYQRKHGLEAVGNVGPRTLAKIRAELVSSTTLGLEDEGNGKRPCAIVPPGHLIAPGWLRKQGGIAPTVPVCQTLPPGIAKKLGITTTSSTTDMTAPKISRVTVSNIASTSATVGWRTNEFATSKVYFGTATSLDLATATSVSSSTPVKVHSLNLTGLATSTLYYYVVQSTDGSNNIATSTQSSFTTLAP